MGRYHDAAAFPVPRRRRIPDEVRQGRRRSELFFDNQPDDIQQIPGNMVMANGVCALWQYALGDGSSSANNALSSGPTYLNNAQTVLYVGDGGRFDWSGTVSIANGGTALTFGTSQTGLQGKYWFDSQDSTNGFYVIASGPPHVVDARLGVPGDDAQQRFEPVVYDDGRVAQPRRRFMPPGNIADQAVDSGFPGELDVSPDERHHGDDELRHRCPDDLGRRHQHERHRAGL